MTNYRQCQYTYDDGMACQQVATDMEQRYCGHHPTMRPMQWTIALEYRSWPGQAQTLVGRDEQEVRERARRYITRHPGVFGAYRLAFRHVQPWHVCEQGDVAMLLPQPVAEPTVVLEPPPGVTDEEIVVAEMAVDLARLHKCPKCGGIMGGDQQVCDAHPGWCPFCGHDVDHQGPCPKQPAARQEV